MKTDNMEPANRKQPVADRLRGGITGAWFVFTARERGALTLILVLALLGIGARYLYGRINTDNDEPSISITAGKTIE